MKLTFTIDQSYDAKYIIVMLGKDNWESRAKLMGFDLNFAQEIHQATTKKAQIRVKEKVNKLVNEAYGLVLPYMEKTKNLYKQSWDEIIGEFSETVAKLTYPWFFDEYEIVVTHFHPGLVKWYENRIGRWWRENPYLQRFITAHEILLAHYFSIHQNIFPDSGLADRQIWALAEIAAIALTGLEEDLRKFWPWVKDRYRINHNYPQLVDLQLKLKEPFLKRESFDEYVKTGIREMKKQPIKNTLPIHLFQ